MWIKKLDVKNTQYGNKVIHENEVAYRPRHTCRAAERDGPHRLSEVGEGITQTGRDTYWWKLILEEWYLLWEAEKYKDNCNCSKVT